MFTFTILFNEGPAVEYKADRENDVYAYAKRIANGREILSIC